MWGFSVDFRGWIIPHTLVLSFRLFLSYYQQIKNKIMITTKRLIDNVTVQNLDIALRMCQIQIDKSILDKIIDLVELIEDKADETSIADICKLQEIWKQEKEV